MPFSAEARNGDATWRRVDITTIAMPKLELAGHELRCPDTDCGCELIIKHGAIMSPHFAHKPGAISSGCAFAGGGESLEHLNAKQAIMTTLRADRLYRAARIEPERILRDGELKRIADVYVEYPDGWIEVHEAQLSRTTIEECRVRTLDYLSMGVGQVIWWFGRANSGDQGLRDWATYECGGCGVIHPTVQRRTLGASPSGDARTGDADVYGSARPVPIAA
jgi:competence CoiA-like predicted nuclease